MLTLLAPTGERMGFYEAARQYDQEALRVIASVMMDEKQQARLFAALAVAWALFQQPLGYPSGMHLHIVAFDVAHHVRAGAGQADVGLPVVC